MDYSQLLFEKYGSALLTASQVAEVIGRSTFSLTADRRNGTGISFKRTGDSENSPVRYPVHEVSKFLNATEKVM